VRWFAHLGQSGRVPRVGSQRPSHAHRSKGKPKPRILGTAIADQKASRAPNEPGPRLSAVTRVARPVAMPPRSASPGACKPPIRRALSGRDVRTHADPAAAPPSRQNLGCGRAGRSRFEPSSPSSVEAIGAVVPSRRARAIGAVEPERLEPSSPSDWSRVSPYLHKRSNRAMTLVVCSENFRLGM